MGQGDDAGDPIDRTRLLAGVIAAMAEGVVVHGPSGVILEANAAAARILGLSMDQLLGREAIDARWALTHPDESPLAPDEIPSEITRLTGRACRNVLLRVRRSSGERAWLQVSTESLGAPRGEHPVVVATFADVTAEHEALLELERGRARLQRLTEAVPGVLLQLLRTSAFVRFQVLSARTGELFGVSADEAMADPRALGRYIPDDIRASAFASLERAGVAGEVWEHDVRLEPPGGTRWVRFRAVPERTPEGTLWHAVVIDVTAERRLAEQLRQAQRREAMGELVAGVAHNFNNVLAVILPNLDAARASASPGQRELLDDAHAAAVSAAELVRQLMRTTRGEPRGAVEAVDTAQVAREVVSLCRRSFDRRIAIVEHGLGAPAHARIGAADLHQVLLNLCLNARDALGGAADPRLEVSLAHEQAGADRHVVLTVRDTGVGMDEATLRRLGEPFFTTKPVGHGTGLGLATAFATVRDYGGTLACESRPGQGATFVLRLPEASPTAAAAAAPVAGAGLAGGRVLVVDDEPLVRRVMRRLLGPLGLVVDEAASGEETLARLETGPLPDAVLLDLSMPGMDGGEALAHIRARWPGLPVIILSGYTGESPPGATAVLTKPARIAELVATLTAAMRR